MDSDGYFDIHIVLFLNLLFEGNVTIKWKMNRRAIKVLKQGTLY